MTDDFLDLDIEPEPAEGELIAQAIEDGALAGALAKAPPPEPPSRMLALAAWFGADGFSIDKLLTFLPDVDMKRRLQQLAADAMAIEVKGEEGIALADAALGPLRKEIKGIELCFDGTDAAPGPTALAYQLHKRLTGLRGDFTKDGKDALDVLGKRIIAERRRLDALAAAEARKVQEEADRQAREAAARAVKIAEEKNTPQPFVEALKKQAETAVAPPVQPRRAPAMASSTVAEKWRAQFACNGGRPETFDEMNGAQLNEFAVLIKAIVDGKAPMAAVRPDWSYLDRRAVSDRKAFDIPGLEAYDEGSLRSKGRR